MSYKEKPIIKLLKYENNSFKLQWLVDDYESCSWQRSKYEAGQFTIEINYNIPNAQKFEKNMFVQFGNDSKDFGIITNVTDQIGPDGKGSQIRSIVGYDSRYILKRRVIKNLNNADTWVYTGKGELCMRNLIKDQCGDGAEEKRRLPLTNTIPTEESAIGKIYSVSESYTNLYDVLVTIATQSEIMWFIELINNEMHLEFYTGNDIHTSVRFDTDYNSLSDGSYEDSSESFSNAVYVGGKGNGANRDIYEGELKDSDENIPSGLDRFESWDNASSLDNEEDYSNEALSKLNEYGQTVSLSGTGLAKCPYIYKEQYDVGDIITVAFSGKTAVAQILSLTEHWAFGQYDMEFEFGKPIQDLNRQLSLLLSQIQRFQATSESSKISNIRYYNIPNELEMPKEDVILDVIGFVGNTGNGQIFKLWFDSQSKTGAKTYHVYFKQLSGSGKLTLTTGVSGASNLEFSGGTYVAIIYVDENGNIGKVTGASSLSELNNDTNFQNKQQVEQLIQESGGGSLKVTDSTDSLTDEDSFLETGTGTVTTGKRHLLSKLWTWICGKLLAGVPNNIELTNEQNVRVRNSTWGKSFYLLGNPSQYPSDDFASIGTTDGNCHIDSADNNAMYLNFYRGNNGINFGNGDNSIVARVTPRGQLWDVAHGFSPSCDSTKAMFDDGAGRFIQIRFANAWINNMISFKVRLSHYSNGRMAEYLCYGYTYGDGRWYNCKAICLGSTTSAPMRIWYGAGSDGVATVLLKWEDIGIDNYPQVDIYDVSSGYSTPNYDPANINITITQSINWARGDTSFLIPFFADTAYHIPTSQPDSRVGAIWIQMG